MKKSLLALLFAVALAVPALAENMWIGGSFGYSNNSPKEGDSTSAYYIEPEFGYNVNESWDIGIDFGYAYDEAGDFFGSTDKTKTLNIAPFARYKMFEIGDFAFLAKGSIFYASVKGDDSGLDGKEYGIRIVPIVTYSINETWSIGATLDFATIAFEKEKCDDADIENTKFGFNANDGDLVHIGFSYHF